MYKSKREVDRFVSDVNEKNRNEVDRALKGLTIAKLYFNIGEYNSAITFLDKYDSFRSNSAGSHKLRGQVFTAQSTNPTIDPSEKSRLQSLALQSYRRSVELDLSQRELLLNIAELMLQLPIEEQGKARYWFEEAEKIYPHNKTIKKLRDKINRAKEGLPTTDILSDDDSKEELNGNGAHGTDSDDNSAFWSASTGGGASFFNNSIARLEMRSETTSTPRTGGSGGVLNSSQTRRFVPRPSPERLATQVRNVEAAQETMLNTLQENSRSMLETNEAILKELHITREETSNYHRESVETMKAFLCEMRGHREEMRDNTRALKDVKSEVVNLCDDMMRQLKSLVVTMKASQDEVDEERKAVKAASAAAASAPKQPEIPDYADLYMQQLARMPQAHQLALFTSQLAEANLMAARSSVVMPQNQCMSNLGHHLPSMPIVQPSMTGMGTPSRPPVGVFDHGLSTPSGAVNTWPSSSPTPQYPLPQQTQTPPQATPKPESTKTPVVSKPGFTTPTTTTPAAVTPAISILKPAAPIAVPATVKTEVKNSPFSTFTVSPFSGTPGAPSTTPSAPKPDVASSNFFSNLNATKTPTSGFSFGTPVPATNNASTPSGAFSFAGAAAEAAQRASTATDDNDDGVHDESTEHDPHFDPIIPLPELVQVKTGEEEEEDLFDNKAKMYRFDPETKEWKERGVGKLKILKHPSKGTFRVLLRREQVHKIAANHMITKDIELKPMASSTTAVCYYAMDFAEETLKLEHLAIRFKLEETLNEFKKVFKACQDELKLKATPTKKDPEVKEKKEEAAAKPATKPEPKPTTEIKAVVEVKPSQEKQSTSIFGTPSNAEPSKTSIFGNATPNPTSIFGSSASATPGSTSIFGGSTSATPGSTSIFGNSTTTPGSTSIFGSKPTTTTGSIFGAESKPASVFGGGFTFNSTPNPEPAAEPSKPSPFAGFSFSGGTSETDTSSKGVDLSASKNLPSFADLAAPAGSTGFGFGTPGTNFSFLGAGAPVFKSSSTPQASNQNDDDDNVDEGNEHDPHFEPIIPLPELVQVVTGEEEEETLFENKAKMYRYDPETKEWKERGVGKLKILKHPSKSTFRILLRREQVHKIAANHMITKDMDLKPMSTSLTAVCYYAMDFAEETLKLEHLAVRFKLEETLNQFKSVFLKCQDDLRAKPDSPSKPEKPKKEESKPSDTNILDKFKPKQGSWECPGCMCRNESDKEQCPACQSIKPGCKAPDTKAPATSGGGGFSFASFATNTTPNSIFGGGQVLEDKCKGLKEQAENLASLDAFKPKPGTWECPGCCCRNDASKIQCPACQTVKPGATVDPKAAAPTTSIFGGGGGTGSGFNFGTSAVASSAPPPTGFKFGITSSTEIKSTPTTNADELSFENQSLKLNTASDAQAMADKISKTQNMKILTLAGNTVGIDAAGTIGKALEKHPEFERAHWKDMFTGRMKTEIPPALKHLGAGIIAANAHLVELDLSDNAFGPIGMEGIVDLLRSPSCFTLQELRLNNTGCGVVGGKLLAKTLMECYNNSGKKLALKIFVLGRSRQENEGAKALAEIFKLMGSLEEVVMPQNGIYHEGISALSDAFANNPNLKILNMNDNTFTEKGAKALANALPKLQKLTVLNLGDCLLQTEGAQLIAGALKEGHTDLQELYLDSNEIKYPGGVSIVDSVANKTKLELLKIDSNQFGADGCKKLLKKLTALGKQDIVETIEDEEVDEDDDEEEEGNQDEEEDENQVGVTVIKARMASASDRSEDEEEEKNMFEGECNLYERIIDDNGSKEDLLGKVELRVVYDDDVYGARIQAILIDEDEADENGDTESETVCNHLIAMQTILTVLDDSRRMEWSALDFSKDPPVYRNFTAEFEEADTAREFREIFNDGKELAEQSEILEQTELLNPEEMYYGQGTDYDD